MGTMGSKIGKQLTVEDLQEGSVPSTPILTPKVKKNELDPRSPSTNISRTPLELLSTTDDQIEINLQDGKTPIRKDHLLLGIDPRSPTTEFKRTPIIVDVSESDLPKKICNKNLDKVRLSANMRTPKSTNNKLLTSEKQAVNIVPPKLLESSPIKPKRDTNKRKSFVGLLETNIDFTETDLDAVIQRKNIKEKVSEPVTPNCIKQISTLKCEIVDPRSPTTDFMRTPIQIIKKNCEIELNEKDDGSTVKNEEENNEIAKTCEIVADLTDLKVVKINEDIESAKEHRDALDNMIVNDGENLLLPSIDKCKEIASNANENIFKETTIIEDSIADENLFNETPELDTPEETRSTLVTPIIENKVNHDLPIVLKDTNSAPVTPPLVNITADVKELDKKLTNLIYQDDTVICPRIIKLKEHNTRSPLKNRNCSEPDKKKSMLKVSDKPRKSDYAVSKIPVFREKGKQIQCENTPPRNMEKRKVKVRKSHWDNADTTLII